MLEQVPGRTGGRAWTANRMKVVSGLGAGTIVFVCSVFFLINYVLSKTENDIRREILEIYRIQTVAQQVTSLGFQLLSAESDSARAVFRFEIQHNSLVLEAETARQPPDFNPLVALLAADLAVEKLPDAYDSLRSRLELLVRSSARLIVADEDLDIRFELSSVRAQTRSDLAVDLQEIIASYETLTVRMLSFIGWMQVVAVAVLVLTITMIWLFGLRPAINRESRARAQLEHSKAEALDLLGQAQAATVAKSQFLAAMSHEIRTPLNGMIAILELLRTERDVTEQHRLLDTIESSGQLLESTVNDILDFSKIEAGELRIEAVAFDLVKLLDQVIALYRPLASERGLELDLIVDLPAPSRIGDPSRLRQVLSNVLSNAIKFTEIGGATVSVSGNAVGQVRIVIEDTGIGMTPAQSARAFNAFEQADSTTTRKYGGSGLGLAIVKHLVGLMQGEIALHSAAGTGTTVTMDLQLPVASVVPPADSGPCPVKPQPLDLNVLAVDDNRTNLLVMDKLLKRLGCRAVLVSSGREAVQLVGGPAFHVLLIDIMMPDMNGMDTLRAIREREADLGRSAVPAIAVTANAYAHQVELYLDAGFSAHVPKPVRLAALRRTLEDFGRSEEARGRRSA